MSTCNGFSFNKTKWLTKKKIFFPPFTHVIKYVNQSEPRQLDSITLYNVVFLLLGFWTYLFIYPESKIVNILKIGLHVLCINSNMFPIQVYICFKMTSSSIQIPPLLTGRKSNGLSYHWISVIRALIHFINPPPSLTRIKLYIRLLWRLWILMDF